MNYGRKDTDASKLFYGAIYFAVAGGVFIGIHPTNREHKISHFLELVAPKLIINSFTVLPKFLLSSVARALSSEGTSC